MSPLDILLIVAGVGYLLTRRMIGDLFEAKTLLILPGVLTVIGVTQLDGVAPVSGASVLFAAVGIALSVVLGVVRGTTVYLAERDGELWMRYRVSSVGLWLLNFALKGALVPVELAVSKSATAAADHTIVLSIGLGIAAENLVVVVRAMLGSSKPLVWAKGEDGAPHRTSPALDQARQWMRGVPAGRRPTRPQRTW